MAKAKVWIKEIEFSDGTKVEFDQNDIVVFVGPNNAGKSASLKETMYLIKGPAQTKVIKSIKLNRDGSEVELLEFLETGFRKTFNSGSAHYSGLGFNIYESHASMAWRESSNISSLTEVFAKFLTTEERLEAASPPRSIRLTQDSPTHPIHSLQRMDRLEAMFSAYFRQAFNTDLIVHRNAGSEVPLYIGERPAVLSGEDRLSESYQEKLEQLDLLHEQGDGMRGFVGVLLNAFIGHHTMLFIDEPEAFLHPPQAKVLGTMIAQNMPTDRQLFLTTHSSDFLKGLLESNNPNLKIIRLQREEAINKVSVLKNSEIKSIWSDSLLRHSNILDGLFHTQVVICESDSDCRFYSAVLTSISEKKGSRRADSLFLHCSGKHRISTVVKALKQLNVTIRIISDFDILNDTNPLKPLYQDLGGNWKDVESDWRLVKDVIDKKKPELEAAELKQEIDSIFAESSSRNVSKEQILLIQKALKKSSAWAHAKEIGKIFIPSGDPIRAFERIQQKFKDHGLFVVEVGELESFVKSVGNHGPKWVNEVLEKDLANDPELDKARRFISEVVSIAADE